MNGEAIVVGGGAAGTLAAIHLLEAGRRVTIVERTGRAGPGVAYATRFAGHLLNVHACRLGVSSAAPDDFAHWLAGRLPDAGGLSFAPRFLYGEYLAESLTRTARNGGLTVVKGEAAGVRTTGGRATVELADGGRLTAESVALALGAPAPASPKLTTPEFLASARYVDCPWDDERLARIHSGRVVLIGSGLTAVDVAVSLADRPIAVHAVSRHGLLPRAHAAAPAPPVSLLPPPGPTSLRDLVRDVRAAAASVEDWRSVIDGLRPSTQRLWQSLDQAEQSRCHRHLATYWSVHRHRMAPGVAAQIDALQRRNRLTVDAGRLAAAVDEGPHASVSLELRAGGTATLRAAAVVNCSGPAARVTDSPPAIVRALFERGLARPDRHGMGLDTTEYGAAVAADGTPSRCLFVLGPLRRGTLWETNAIPELRTQAELLPVAMQRALGGGGNELRLDAA